MSVPCTFGEAWWIIDFLADSTQIVPSETAEQFLAQVRKSRQDPLMRAVVERRGWSEMAERMERVLAAFVDFQRAVQPATYKGTEQEEGER